MQLVLPSLAFFRRFSGGTGSRALQRELPAGTAFGFPAGKETVIRCLKGRLWITDGRAGDLVLFPGGKFTADHDAKVVIEALDDASVEIHG